MVELLAWHIWATDAMRRVISKATEASDIACQGCARTLRARSSLEQLRTSTLIDATRRHVMQAVFHVFCSNWRRESKRRDKKRLSRNATKFTTTELTMEKDSPQPPIRSGVPSCCRESVSHKLYMPGPHVRPLTARCPDLLPNCPQSGPISLSGCPQSGTGPVVRLSVEWTGPVVRLSVEWAGPVVQLSVEWASPVVQTHYRVVREVHRSQSSGGPSTAVGRVSQSVLLSGSVVRQVGRSVALFSMQDTCIGYLYRIHVQVTLTTGYT